MSTVQRVIDTEVFWRAITFVCNGEAPSIFGYTRMISGNGVHISIVHVSLSSDLRTTQFKISIVFVHFAIPLYDCH
jgi:hypothetical protein